MASKRAQDTRAIKAALKAEGIEVLRVEHGHGTAYCWVTVNVARGTTETAIKQAYQIVARILGRETWPWETNCIGVYA